MNKVIEKWLASGDLKPCYFQNAGINYSLIRVEKNQDFEYLFCQNLYHGKSTERQSSFQYAGIYCKKDGLVYDAGYMFEAQGSLRGRSAISLCEQLEESVRRKVECAIGNDKNNLHITNITNEKILEQIEYLYRYKAKREARQRYLNMEDWKTPTYQCGYTFRQWKEDSLLDYILDPEGYAGKEAEAYLVNNQEKILYTFLENEAIEKKYQTLIADKDNPVHTIKKIKMVMAKTNAKTVHVTIKKNDIEFTFKVEANSLRGNYGEYYPAWYITGSDRKKFEELFGRNANYAPKEIIRITYAKKELYRAEG